MAYNRPPDGACGKEREWQSDRSANEDEQQRLTHDEPLHRAAVGAERDAYAQLRGPAPDRVRDRPVQTQARQAERRRAKRHRQPAEESLDANRPDDPAVERVDRANGRRGSDSRKALAHRIRERRGIA